MNLQLGRKTLVNNIERKIRMFLCFIFNLNLIEVITKRTEKTRKKWIHILDPICHAFTILF